MAHLRGRRFGPSLDGISTDMKRAGPLAKVVASSARGIGVSRTVVAARPQSAGRRCVNTYGPLTINNFIGVDHGYARSYGTLAPALVPLRHHHPTSRSFSGREDTFGAAPFRRCVDKAQALPWATHGGP